MSKLKKIFISVAVVISVLTASFIISICNIRSNVGIAFGSPYSVVIFDHSQTKSNEYKEEDELGKIEKQINGLTNLSIYSKLINGASLSKKIFMDTEGKFSKWTSDLLNKNLVVEFIYTSNQDLVVYEGDIPRTISYVCLSLVIPNTTEFTEIAVYYSTTSNASDNEKNDSYATNTPLILYGNAKDFLEGIEK